MEELERASGDACCSHEHEHAHNSSHQHDHRNAPAASATTGNEISDERAFILELVDAFDDAANTLARVEELLAFFPQWVDLCDEDGRTALFFAVYSENLALVQLLLEAGASPRASAESLMVLASTSGNLEILRVLHNFGAKVNDEYYLDTGISPLYVACKRGHLQVVQWLLENGADIEAVDEDDVTPFMVAAGQAHVQIVKLLASKGASTEIATSSGLSVAYFAAYSGHLALLRFFLEKNMALADADGNFTNLLDGAVRGNHLVIAKYVLENVNVADEHIDEALMLAVRFKHLELVELLILHDTDVEEIDENGLTPLIAVAQSGDVQIAEALIEAGASLTRVSPSTGYTPVHEMAKCGHHQLLELVHTLQPEIDFAVISQFDSLTPLHLAAANDHEGAVRFLVDVVTARERDSEEGANEGATIDVPGPRGQTPLILAAENGSLSAVKALVAAGASVNARTGSGLTALIGAAYVGEIEIVRVLCENGADVNLATNTGVTPLHAAAEYGHVSLVEYLLEERQAAANFTWTGVSSILAGPVMNGHLTVIFVLVAHGAQFEYTGGQWLSPLHLAAQYKQLGAVQLLLLATGMDVNAMNDNPEDGVEMRSTPLMVAAHRGYLDIVRSLCEKGADVELRDQEGRSALDLAQLARKSEVVEYLTKERNACVDGLLEL
ncbi:Tkl protein kinase [Globisporangium polare]